VIPALTHQHLNLRDENATVEHARAMASQFVLSPALQHPERGLVVFLSGNLGAGKTTWARALLRGLGHQGRVRSPSFTLMEPYELPQLQLYHFDFYRFSAGEEWREAGFEELIGAAHSVSLIEWPEMASDSLSAPDLWLKFSPFSEAGEDARLLNVESYSVVGETLLASVKPA
jgi:tRNA threonylcarbamoyladenosine biosynthesis protein TsaE